MFVADWALGVKMAKNRESSGAPMQIADCGLRLAKARLTMLSLRVIMTSLAEDYLLLLMKFFPAHGRGAITCRGVTAHQKPVE